jgi:YjbE family integral membrane protein
MTFDAHFLTNLLSIVVIDITLAGDNAVVIAMAVRTLPKHQRRKGIIFGALAAVVVRVVITFFVAQLLTVAFVKLVGGLVILWVAMKLFTGGEAEHGTRADAGSIWEAVKIIVVADITMGVDNMLAVGGASHGDVGLLLFGLGLSIPFVVFASDFLSRLMDRYPVILYIGAAVLGRVSGSMIMTDPTVTARLQPSQAVVYLVEGVFTVAVVVAGWWLQRRVKRRRLAGQEQLAQERVAAPLP